MIDQLLSSKVLSIVLLIVTVGLVVAMFLGYLPEATGLLILGFVFPGGLAAWRDWINSKGWMTYVLVGLCVLGAITMALGWITPESFIYVLGGVAGGAALTMAKAVSRVPEGEPILKKAA
jgi:hypothetical protein